MGGTSDGGDGMTHFLDKIVGPLFTDKDISLEIVWFDPWNHPNTKIIEGAILPSKRIVVMSDQDSYWFEADGTSPKGTFLLKVNDA